MHVNCVYIWQHLGFGSVLQKVNILQDKPTEHISITVVPVPVKKEITPSDHL